MWDLKSPPAIPATWGGTFFTCLLDELMAPSSLEQNIPCVTQVQTVPKDTAWVLPIGSCSIQAHLHQTTACWVKGTLRGRTCLSTMLEPEGRLRARQGVGAQWMGAA